MVLLVLSACIACRSSSRPDARAEAAELIAKTVQALQPADKITHVILDDTDRGVTFEVWIDAQGSRARADRTDNGHRLSEIIVNGRTYNRIPSLSRLMTPDALASLALPWFVAPEGGLAAVQSATVDRKKVEGRQVIIIHQLTALVGNGGWSSVPGLYTQGYAENAPCPLRRTLTVDASSYVPLSYDVTVLCLQAGYRQDYHYTAAYRNVEFLDRDSLPDSWFSPEAVRAGILDEELQALKASSFELYWLGRDLPPELKEIPDDGLLDARANWPSSDGPGPYFDYGSLEATPSGLFIYEWQLGYTAPVCSPQWQVYRTQTVETKFGPALYCDAEEDQLVLTIGDTTVRLVGPSFESPQWFIDRANALVPPK